MLLFALAAAIAVAVAGDQPNAPRASVEPSASSELRPTRAVEGRWKAVKLDRHSVPSGRWSAWMQFAADGTMSGYDGCNGVWGSYSIKDDLMTFANTAMTTRACQPEDDPRFEERQNLFQHIFVGAARFSITGGALKLVGQPGPTGAFRRERAKP